MLINRFKIYKSSEITSVNKILSWRWYNAKQISRRKHVFRYNNRKIK